MSSSVLDSLVLEYVTSEGLIDLTDESLLQREVDEVSTHPTIPATSGNQARYVTFPLMYSDRGRERQVSQAAH